MASVEMVEIWRGGFRESVHRGHAVVCDASGAIVASWGDPDKVFLPRSSSKMIQALPLVQSGAADARRLGSEQLALACASHNGAEIHTGRVARWLADLGLSETDLRCGPQMPDDPDAFRHFTCSEDAPCQLHNNCSGKHTGFLTLAQHLDAGPEYIDPLHPVQQAVRAAWEDLTQEDCPGYGIDGCSAPNFASTLAGMARAMASFAAARRGRGSRQEAQARLVEAMMAHPELVAGEGRACTELMRALAGAGVAKTGAEGCFAAILPGKGFGVALKIEDGTTRASESAISAILVALGVLDPAHPTARRFIAPRIPNRRGVDTGQLRPVPGTFDRPTLG
ncbi:asparaginase [Tropicimonas sp. IMCC6043]|uniref:asparaginase n=1 Tax=Tropicimonas sp. IMCC6043 TaxID=2510645 RepID=UPI00101DFC17|nr:asparaginase [Tropicimonas sp. IMCC6043]RYH10928.1 asparaginase [Tropicimonas sp. IMCC6043]